MPLITTTTQESDGSDWITTTASTDTTVTLPNASTSAGSTITVSNTGAYSSNTVTWDHISTSWTDPTTENTKEIKALKDKLQELEEMMADIVLLKG